MTELHTILAWIVMVGNGLAGGWALAAHFQSWLRHRSLWVFTAIVQVAVVIQVTIGAFLLSREGVEAPQFHVFYGFVALISVGLIYSYRHQLKDWIYALYGGGGLFLMGLAIRAFTLTG
ncbi:MAG: hypothetical protein V3V01_13945 [Acidimicrobiales bacterium]